MSSYIRRFRSFLRRNETAKGLFLIGIVLLGAIAVWGAIRFALNTEYPVLVVSSGSMCPPTNCVLAIGDLIVIRGQDPRTIQAGPSCGTVIAGPPYGTIIVFRPDASRPDYLVVHRVREILQSNSGELSFRTQGDANSGCDPWRVPASSLVGVYQYTIPIPYLGTAILTIRDFMATPQGLLVVVALIVALFAIEIMEPSKKKPPAPTSPTVTKE